MTAAVRNVLLFGPCAAVAGGLLGCRLVFGRWGGVLDLARRLSWPTAAMLAALVYGAGLMVAFLRLHLTADADRPVSFLESILVLGISFFAFGALLTLTAVLSPLFAGPGT